MTYSHCSFKLLFIELAPLFGNIIIEQILSSRNLSGNMYKDAMFCEETTKLDISMLHRTRQFWTIILTKWCANFPQHRECHFWFIIVHSCTVTRLRTQSRVADILLSHPTERSEGESNTMSERKKKPYGVLPLAWWKRCSRSISLIAITSKKVS